jgi:biotin carboxylase
MVGALSDFQLEGVDTTIPFLRDLIQRREFVNGATNACWVEEQISRSAQRGTPRFGACQGEKRP